MGKQPLNSESSDTRTSKCLGAVRRYARQVAKRFFPQKIVLFGSHAYGQPNAASDVDLLVIMPTKNQIDQASNIRLAFPPPPFPMDLIVRTPEKCQRRLEEGESFLTEIMSNGIVLYEEDNGKVGPQSSRSNSV